MLSSFFPCVLLSLWASANVNSTFRKYSQQYSSRRLTGAEAAQRVLSANGVYGVRIERISGNLTDHYDPRTNVIRLSDSVYDNTSTAAIGVACHEAGHAVQYAELRSHQAESRHYPCHQHRLEAGHTADSHWPAAVLRGGCFLFLRISWHRLLWSFPGVPAGDPSRGIQRQPPRSCRHRRGRPADGGGTEGC